MRYRERFIVTASLIALQGGMYAHAQDPWTAYLQRWLAAGGDRRPWTLQVRKGDAKTGWWRRDPGLARLVADQELTIEILEPADAAGLWQAKQWGPGAHWLLLDRSATGPVAGDGVATGEDLLTAIHAVQEQTGWERREAFLKDHPDHGEALEARLATSLTLAMDRFRVLVEDRQATPARLDHPGRFLQAREEVGRVADEVFAEVADTLDRLNEMPDGWRISASASFRFGLTLHVLDAGASPHMCAAMRRMRDASLAEWTGSPDRDQDPAQKALYGPSALWMSCELALGDGTLGSFPRLTAAPGRVYPQADLLVFIANQIRDPAAMLQFLAAVPAEAPEGPVSPAQWQAFRYRQACLMAFFARAYAQSEQWDQAQAALQECRRWSGSGWKGLGLLRQFAPPAAADRPDKLTEKSATPAKKPAAAAVPADGAKAKPGETPGGTGKDAREPTRPGAGHSGNANADGFRERADADGDRERAEAAAALPAPGEPAGQPPKAFLEVLRSDPAPDLPPPPQPPTGPTLLQRLDRFIRQNPDHLDARRERYALLRPRMPLPDLEAVLAEDAALAWIPLDFDRKAPWLTQPDVWVGRAGRLMPELEAALGRWPSSVSLWRLWVSWLPFRPAPRSPYAFAQDLAVPRPRGEWLADLPKEVHLAVAAELRASARYPLMRDWFQGAWEVARLRAEDPRGTRATLYQGLEEALIALRLKTELEALRRQK